MAKNERKQRKKKARQERLRKEKHVRHYGPGSQDESALAAYDDDRGDGLELPPATASERMLRDLTTGPSLLGKLGALLPEGQRDRQRRQQAQELAYDALEQPDPARATALARQALELDPGCSDALYTLALNAAGSRQEQVQLLEQAVAVAEQRLGGPRYFAENQGHFWGLLETRPYMRARAALADILRGQGRWPEAIRHYEVLLELNPNDNQGLRDVLLGCYLRADDLAGAGRLLKQYEGDDSALFAYGRVLERFLAGDQQGAATARQQAHDANAHVEAYLTGRKRLPRRLPDYYTPGDETEAIHCGVYLGDAWKRHAEAVAWLRGLRK